MRKLLLIFLFVFGLTVQIIAQDRTVSGKLTSSEDEATIPGVTIVLKGTTTGTTSDIDGNYKLSVPSDGGTLVYSFVGLTTKEIEIGARTTINVTMDSDDKQLNEVVVTAMGISRDKASIGYSQQTLATEELNRVKTDNIMANLSGKVAGVNVRMNQTMGGSAVISIRGNSSFTNNNPLFVIDGVPVSNERRGSALQAAGRRGYDYGNPAADINPDDVASMSVLKGAAATSLYGSRGQNGVILITTKKGSAGKGVGVDFSTGITVGQIDKSTFIEYQNEYGGGYAPFAGWNSKVGNPNGWGEGEINLTTEDASYGQKFDGQLMYQWDSFVPGEPNYGKAYEYKAAENTPTTFFESQIIKNTNVALHGGNETASFRLSYTNLDQDDIMPNSNLKKNTVGFNGSIKLSDRLSSDVMFQYSKQETVGRFSTGYGDNMMAQFRQWYQVNVDMQQLKSVYDRTGLNYTWNAADETNPLKPIYWDNPYWTRHENYSSDARDRILSKVGIQYKLTDWLTASGRASIDNYSEIREERRAVGSVPTEFGVANADEPSGYAQTDIENTEWNYNLMLSVNKEINDNVSVTGLIGFNMRKESYERTFASTSGGLVIPGIYALSNSKGALPFPIETLYEREVYGYFANANLGFRDFIYVDANFRRDVSSALPTASNSYNYYGVGLGLVFSELVDVSWMDFGKARVSYGTVGNDTRALRVNDTFSRTATNFGTVPQYTLPNVKNNSLLKPEQTKEIEFGIEGTFLDTRLNFDVAYFSRSTTNQLMAVDVSPTTGFTSKFINAGTVSNKGVELVVWGDVVRTNDFKYTITANLTKIKSKVEDLDDLNGEGPNNYTLNSYQGGISTNATVGYPFGVLRGNGYKYHDNGQRIVDANGSYVVATNQVIGDPNPDFTLGINNSISYKNISLGFLIDISQGGDVYSLDMHYGQGTGLAANTVGLNDLGNPVRDPVVVNTDGTYSAESGGIIFEGVQADGSPNTVRRRADSYAGAFYWGNATRNPGEMTVYDASYVKFRELSLTYKLPADFLGSWSQGISLSLVGRNLWIISKNVPYADPESGIGTASSAGYLSGSYPTVRSLGFKVDFKF